MKERPVRHIFHNSKQKKFSGLKNRDFLLKSVLNDGWEAKQFKNLNLKLGSLPVNR